MDTILLNCQINGVSVDAYITELVIELMAMNSHQLRRMIQNNSVSYETRVVAESVFMER